MNGLNLARAFDDKDFREVLRASGPNPFLKTGERLGLPAVLGFYSPKEAWQDLQEKLDTEIFEIPMPPPSVPGLRLYNGLKDQLREKGVRIVVGLSGLTPIIGARPYQWVLTGESRKSPVYRANCHRSGHGEIFWRRS